MTTIEATRPILVPQKGAPDLTIVSGVVPYYAEVLSAVAGTDMPELPFVAAGASLGANVGQPEFNDPVEKAVAVARGLDVASKIVNGQEVPLVGFSSTRWLTGISSPNSTLHVIQGRKDSKYMSVEVATSIPVIHGATNFVNTGTGDQLCAGGHSYDKTADPNTTFAVDTPSLVVTDTEQPSGDQLAEEVKYAIDEPHHKGILAVGAVAAGRLLEAVAQDELGRSRGDLRVFTESSSLLMLAHLREHGHQLAPSHSPVVREAGQRAISALIAGTATSFEDHRHARTTNTGYIARGLRAIDFTTDDYEPVVAGVMRNMTVDKSYEHFADLASLNGSSVETFVKAQTASFFANLLGVKL